LVTNTFIQFLQDKGRLKTAFAEARLNNQQNADLLSGAAALARSWETIDASERHLLLKETIARVEIGQAAISIAVARRGLLHAIAVRGVESEKQIFSDSATAKLTRPYSVVVPANLIRRGGERRVISPAGMNSDASRPNPALIKAVARAHVWREKLTSGEARNLRDLAKQAGVSPRYINKIIHLAYISPDLVEAILAGRQPLDMTVENSRHGVTFAWPPLDPRPDQHSHNRE